MNQPSLSPNRRGEKSPFLLRTIRTQPYLYSAICKARLYYSRHIAGADSRELFLSNRDLFAMDAYEAQQVESMEANLVCFLHNAGHFIG